MHRGAWWAAVHGASQSRMTGLGRSPGGGYGHPLLYSCLENPYGQRSQAGYSPCGHKESDMTELLSRAHTAHIYYVDIIYWLIL